MCSCSITVMCDDGREYNETSTTCVLCPIGYYRTAFVHDLCEMCDPDFITPTEGSETEASCSIGMLFLFFKESCIIDCTLRYYYSDGNMWMKMQFVGMLLNHSVWLLQLIAQQDLTSRPHSSANHVNAAGISRTSGRMDVWSVQATWPQLCLAPKKCLSV